MQATDEEIDRYTTLSSLFIQSIANILTQFDRFMQIESGGFYVYLGEEGVEIRHGDGWRAGFIRQQDDWFLFVPDQKTIID